MTVHLFALHNKSTHTQTHNNTKNMTTKNGNGNGNLSSAFIPYDSLSIDQKYAFLKFRQGQNILVTGPGGTGKTRWIQFLVQYMHSVEKNHQVCALTGCAAVLLNCGAKTLHSWSGIRMGKGPTDAILLRICRNRNAVKAWRQVYVLIIDEVSMMSAKLLDLLDKIGRATRKCARPFGGIQVILTGDFFQLPPIGNSMEDPLSSAFCFEWNQWSTVFPRENCIQLTTMFRQDDPTFVRILLEIRRGELSDESRDILLTYVNRDFAEEQQKQKQSETTTTTGGPPLVPTKIFPIRARADYTNETMYKALGDDVEEMEYVSRVQTNVQVDLETGQPLDADVLLASKWLTPEDMEREVARMMDGMQVTEVVRLKIGTVVMCTANIDLEHGICNGAQGVVIDFGDSTMKNEMPSVLIGGQNSMAVPIVRFANGCIRKIDFFARQSEEYPTIVVAQIPLRMAWALTIHKMQGATLDMAEMDIGKTVFEYGQTYVALSRVRSLQGLYLTEFWPHKIKANPLVLSFYDGLPSWTTEEMQTVLDANFIKMTTNEYPSLRNELSAYFSSSSSSSTSSSSLLESEGTTNKRILSSTTTSTTNTKKNKSSSSLTSIKDQIRQQYASIQVVKSSESGPK